MCDMHFCMFAARVLTQCVIFNYTICADICVKTCLPILANFSTSCVSIHCPKLIGRLVPIKLTFCLRSFKAKPQSVQRQWTGEPDECNCVTNLP